MSNPNSEPLALFDHAATPPAARVQELRAQIERHNSLYYQQAAPEISDREFDELLRELADLDACRRELSGRKKLGDALDVPGRIAGAIVRQHIVVGVFVEQDHARIVGADVTRHVALALLITKRLRDSNRAFDAG